MRARKPKHIQERLEKYSSVIESQPSCCKGEWISKYCPQAQQVHVDLGCGKGLFVIESAKRNPNILFVGIDNEAICIALAAQKAQEAHLTNVVFVQSDGSYIQDFFAPHEVSTLYLNFCTPRPKAKHAALRLTHANYLCSYQKVLGEQGCILFKTDSQPFFDWSLTQFSATNYSLSCLTRNLHAEPIANIETEYEKRLSAIGATIHFVKAIPPKELPDSVEQSASMSLGDYLPQNLEDLTYIPYGMEDFVQNKINWQKKHSQ